MIWHRSRWCCFCFDNFVNLSGHPEKKDPFSNHIMRTGKRNSQVPYRRDRAFIFTVPPCILPASLYYADNIRFAFKRGALRVLPPFALRRHRRRWDTRKFASRNTRLINTVTFVKFRLYTARGSSASVLPVVVGKVTKLPAERRAGGFGWTEGVPTRDLVRARCVCWTGLQLVRCR